MNRIVVRRAGHTESVHRVHVAVSDCAGVVRHAGVPETVTFLRSVAKPFQTLPLIEDGVANALGLSEDEIAVAAASHSSEPGHLAAARSILKKAGLGEDALACGGHPPFHVASAEALTREARVPSPIHNNCSGKHAGMLALARHHQWPTEGYWRPDHPVQQRMRTEVVKWTETDEDDLPTAVDGCGVSTFAVSLSAVARAFACLGRASRDEPGPSKVVRAMLSNPWHVGGTGRLCTELMQAAGGDLLAKVGAEGVYCASIPALDLGVALKVEDGARRASEVALLAVLTQLRVLTPAAQDKLSRFVQPYVLNTRGEQVGEILPNIDLESQ